jgi:hypothetical protein
MPRVLRLDSEHLDKAIDALQQARATHQDALDFELVDHVAACLRSVVGASKLLHFANPEVFPIWDKNVERFRRGTNPSQLHMQQTKNYALYAQQVHETRQARTFYKFYDEFIQAYQERLKRLYIDSYRLTPVRAIEAAAFELAGDEPV